ncbi:hypothetical protein E2553_35230 [Paraburkholderia dipogonis]|uniref:Uncharacterized protein n=1 Tax=Paraburkholderia dipogonis TaxID=1211383 RepID=A0A4Y8MWT0_9BURK|nr:hypothetical protein [Paraburkholderia dipogonis]TFE41894.1 hypothetical protein E2553_35230 [Paraburkholderia dipogonis]
MNMRIELISDVLRENNLEYPTLAVLQSTEDLYTALLLQPAARVTVREDFIRNSDCDQAHQLFSSIAREAHARAVELFVTPEYSFPWKTIEELLNAGITPAAGKLWVLGCESLSLGELAGLKARFAGRATVIHENLAQQPAAARFLDPLVYLFRTRELNAGPEHIVMVVQFKTAPSGDPQNIEATRMAKGEEVYLFERGKEVRLISIICSDAFGFDQDLVKDNYEHLLLLHIQLNDSPRNEAYMRYRRQLYDYDCDSTEVICLNWAENIWFDMKDGAAPLRKTNIPASAWHSKSKKFATEDEVVDGNHRKGLYYTYETGQHRHMVHFSYRPAAFVLEATKVRHHGVEAARSRRRGPALTHVLHWDGAKGAWAEAVPPADDGFAAMTDDYGASVRMLNGIHATSPLNVERLACITNGEFGPRQDWFEAPNIFTMGLESRAEVMRRISVALDPEGTLFRDHRIRAVSALASISAGDLPVPSHMKDIQQGYEFGWSRQAPNCNVSSLVDHRPAALVYAGENPAQTTLRNLSAKVTAITAKSDYADRFCVLYREGPDVKRFAAPNEPSITKIDSHPGKNFTEPEK